MVDGEEKKKTFDKLQKDLILHIIPMDKKYTDEDSGSKG